MFHSIRTLLSGRGALPHAGRASLFENLYKEATFTAVWYFTTCTSSKVQLTTSWKNTWYISHASLLKSSSKRLCFLPTENTTPNYGEIGSEFESAI